MDSLYTTMGIGFFLMRKQIRIRMQIRMQIRMRIRMRILYTGLVPPLLTLVALSEAGITCDL
jgi:hypothetical protein